MSSPDSQHLYLWILARWIDVWMDLWIVLIEDAIYLLCIFLRERLNAGLLLLMVEMAAFGTCSCHCGMMQYDVQHLGRMMGFALTHTSSAEL